MRNPIHSLAVAALVSALTTVAAAQPANDPEHLAAQREQAEHDAELARERAERQAEQQRAAAERAAERAQAEAERQRAAQDADSRRERAGVESDLQRARDELQKAAQEVARLSNQLAAPFVTDVARQFRFAGQRAMLGIGIEDTDRGVRVASVSPNGPAAAAGLVVGDTIVSIDGAELADNRAAGGGKQSPSEILLAQMANVDPGEDVELRVGNVQGVERDVTVRVRDVSPHTWAAPFNDFAFSYKGPGSWFARASPWSQMQLVTLTPALGAYFGTSKGLLVVRGPQNDALGIQDGDVILDIGGREPTAPEHALRILGSFEDGEPLKVTVMRNQRRQTLDIKIPADSSAVK